MKIVIDIDENVFTRLFDNGIEDYAIINDDLFAIAKSIRNCTPLPKGYGDLVDRNAINERFYGIWRELECYSNQPTYKELLDKWSMCMDTAPVIIEADEEE